MDKCAKLQVKAVIVKDGVAVAAGRNDPVDPCDGNCEIDKKCVRSIHAETSALMQCAKNAISTKGAVLHVNYFPCPDCVKAIKYAGIKKVYYQHEYPHRYENNFSDGMELVKV